MIFCFTKSQNHYPKFNYSPTVTAHVSLFITRIYTGPRLATQQESDSAVCCNKMSRDAFMSEALYEANKALEKFAVALRECACLNMAEGADGKSQMYVLFCYFA